MTTLLEHKEAIREVIDLFSTLEINGDTATNIHYGKAILVQEIDGTEMVIDRSYRYSDTLILVDGTWLIKRREQYLVLSETRPL